MATDGVNVRQVPIRLHTSLSTLSIPDVPYLLPTSWRRTHLSTLVNRLLQQSGVAGVEDAAPANESTQTIPFDFIIDGEILRTSLDQYLETKGLTEESTLVIEYVRSTLPPTFTASFEHDDWISSVDASKPGYFLTSSYDGSLRVFGTSTADKPLSTFQAGASASLTDACWLPGPSSNVAAVGMDGALRICSLPTGADAEDGKEAILRTISYTRAFDTPAPLSSVACNRSGDTLLTAGWDGCVAIWDAASCQDTTAADEENAEERAGAKRRKGTKGRSVNDDVPSRKPLSLFWHVTPSSGFERLPGANARVSRAVWAADRMAVSAGWDGSVRGWDVKEGVMAVNKTSDKVILALDAVHNPAGTTSESVITGHVDRSAALWDLRTATTNISISFLNAHTAPVRVVRAHPIASHLFATGSHDGAVKLWDCRSPRAALFSVVRPRKAGTQTDKNADVAKILALDWDLSGQTIVAGGEDCQLTVHRGHGIGAELTASLKA